MCCRSDSGDRVMRANKACRWITDRPGDTLIPQGDVHDADLAVRTINVDLCKEYIEEYDFSSDNGSEPPALMLCR